MQQQHQDDSMGKGVSSFTHVLAATFASLIAAAQRYRRPESTVVGDQNIIPQLHRTESGRVGKIETFSHYVARQIGFEDASEVPELCRLAQDYLIKFKGCEESIYEYLDKEKETDSLYVKLVDEFDRCILSYFAFHWNQAASMISQALSIEPKEKIKLKEIILAATRKQRFERVSEKLKVTRLFSTLVEEMKAIRGDSQCTDVMVPVAHSERSPVLLLMGGGMGAGKSTVLKDILKEPFWSGAAKNAVVVEADAFKESDVIYRALNSRGHHDDMLQTAELVHQSSTDAASSLLVTALNEGRDVIMDGTLSWEPFVEQTIAMARNVHKCMYRMGVGYKVAEDGTVTENYWEQVNEAEEEEHQLEINNNRESRNRKPYRIELVGVVCDGYLAVVRGIRRAIMTRRAVRVNSQLKSHKRFANAFPRYCKLVDNARLFSTNSARGPPKLIGWKDGDHNLLVDTEEIKCLKMIGGLNAEADSIYELYKEPSPIMEPGSVWNDIVLSASRPSDQKELRECIQKIEKSIRKM
ncbi:calmodulin calcium-dependent NAD kinase-like [Gastrolobium bilobum]|uniref:calmodulin calcium-dependent NAD kinase-like n=1 Tax=Gastrolobium bilobum TaxID=150636 RepID=UPI002AB04415|nr:calmodulin calcium-dependent NAD kinase-like [Gastrolobium bilobum]